TWSGHWNYSFLCGSISVCSIASNSSLTATTILQKTLIALLRGEFFTRTQGILVLSTRSLNRVDYGFAAMRSWRLQVFCELQELHHLCQRQPVNDIHQRAAQNVALGIRSEERRVGKGGSRE